MSKQAEKPVIVTREVGERVDAIFSFEPDSIKGLGDGVFEATITTSNVDRSNEVIATSGIDTATWEATGMPVMYGHDYSGLPIGKGISFRKFNNKMTSKFQLAVAEYDFAGTVAKLIKGGYLNSVSIGGVVREWSEDFKTIMKMEMVEFSVVPIPANADAVITARSLQEATGKSFDTIKGEYEDFREQVVLDKFKSMPDDEIKDAIKVLKTLVARLEDSAEAMPLTDDKTKQATVKRYKLKEARAVATQSQQIVRKLKLSIKD